MAETTSNANGCPVAAIGASAGGIDALSRFFKAVPTNSGIAYVVIQHLDPTRKSILADLLNRLSNLQVTEVKDEPEIKPDRVYVISPDSTLTIRDGHLHMEKPAEARGRRMPIDAFFKSMAKECCERGVGIVLSGTGTDGTLGLKEIKASGGMVMVQDPEEAEQGGMPRSAIATGLVDHVLPVEQMPDELVAFVRHPYVRAAPERIDDIDQEGGFGSVLAMLRERKEYDFRPYKAGTVTRRIQRRMGINHIEDLDEYIRLLDQNAGEIDELFNDMFIGVTSFFREPEAWNALAQEVLPGLVRECCDADRPLRAWVPGCSTGEEAYTLGILLREEVRRSHQECEFQIFASDVDRTALTKGREGLYPDAIAQDVPPELLQRYFHAVEGDHHYRVSKHLREQTVFAHQNVLGDPPFSKLDLICCRNLLIYLLPEYHRDVLMLFHFGLRFGGYLFLGTAENVGRHSDLFQTMSQKWRIFRRIGGHHAPDVTMPIVRIRRRKARVKPATEESAQEAAASREERLRSEKSAGETRATPQRFTDWARQILVSRYAPTCVLIDREGQVLYFAGATHDYLVQPIGLPTRDVYALSREGLGPKLQEAVTKATETHGPVAVESLVRRGRDYAPIKFVVTPLAPSEGAEGRLLIAFEDVLPPDEAEPGPGASSKELQRLRTELEIAHSELNATLGRLDSAHENHRAANEELMSMNEELQSTNEELETSKEELQSLNEELVTVNHQVQSKVEELEKANDDLTNLLTSTEIATLFLDLNFRIMRYTPALRSLLNLLPADIGRPITDFAHPVLGAEMIKAARVVLQDRRSVDHEVQAPGGDWYLRRVLPYIREGHGIHGVVITFTKITERKRTEEHQKMLIGELDHRVKNTLATVSTLATQSLRRASSLDEFAKAFEGRIQALAKAHTLMTESRWKGAELKSLLEHAVAPYVRDRSGACRLEGPPITIQPREAMTLMMIFHELATNAAKYGAFSASNGRVYITWDVVSADGETPLEIVWQEHDGPPVKLPEGKQGFGTQFIQRSTSYELHGKASIDYLSDGLRCELRLPWGASAGRHARKS